VWRDVIGNDEEILAARVGIHWEGYDEPVWGVAYFEEYVQTKRDGTPTQMWQKFRRLMIAKCAEALGFRKAAPDYFSGLYTAEEMGQAEVPASRESQERPSEPWAVTPPPEPKFASQDWAVVLADVESVEQLHAVFLRVQEAGELGMPFSPEHREHVEGLAALFGLDDPTPNVTVQQMIGAVKRAIEEAAPVEGEVVEEEEQDLPPLQVQVNDEPVTEWPTVEPGSGVFPVPDDRTQERIDAMGAADD